MYLIFIQLRCNIFGMTIVNYHQIYVYHVRNFFNVEFIYFKICKLLMLTSPCNICWLCKAMIGYYKSYKVNTHKEDERMEDSVKYRMQNDLHMKTKEAQGCCLQPSSSYHHTTSLTLFMLLPNK